VVKKRVAISLEEKVKKDRKRENDPNKDIFREEECRPRGRKGWGSDGLNKHRLEKSSRGN